jgi:membrane-associated protein
VVFAIVLGILIDHLLRWWHKHLARNDAESVDEWLDGGPEGSVPAHTSVSPLRASSPTEAEQRGK